MFNYSVHQLTAMEASDIATFLSICNVCCVIFGLLVCQCTIQKLSKCRPATKDILRVLILIQISSITNSIGILYYYISLCIIIYLSILITISQAMRSYSKKNKSRSSSQNQQSSQSQSSQNYSNKQPTGVSDKKRRKIQSATSSTSSTKSDTTTGHHRCWLCDLPAISEHNSLVSARMPNSNQWVWVHSLCLWPLISHIGFSVINTLNVLGEVRGQNSVAFHRCHLNSSAPGNHKSEAVFIQRLQQFVEQFAGTAECVWEDTVRVWPYVRLFFNFFFFFPLFFSLTTFF